MSTQIGTKAESSGYREGMGPQTVGEPAGHRAPGARRRAPAVRHARTAASATLPAGRSTAAASQTSAFRSILFHRRPPGAPGPRHAGRAPGHPGTARSRPKAPARTRAAAAGAPAGTPGCFMGGGPDGDNDTGHPAATSDRDARQRRPTAARRGSSAAGRCVHL
ncbi:hypothetical protein GCM10018781_22920 [Kitasatospora indigofera]|uniref:Uncharacterized protein n=1 Tax=Kitasatospora indigofera TaxID=67307 RepID=A0A919FKP1_9ACTN|nr:hypothetical protein GCM10018781_22920 [Kitasatospora indigofera]